MAPIVAGTSRLADESHEFVAQFCVRTLDTNNQVNPGQRASKRFIVLPEVRDFFGTILKGLYVGPHFSLALLLLSA